MKLNHTPNLICLIGIDGSGKTTLANEFVKEADKSGYKYCYVWGNANPIFLKPLRSIAHLTVLRKVDMKKDNNQYEEIKEKVSSKYNILSWIYSRVLIFDYFIWLFFKVKIPIFFGKKIICDRYIFDVAVNLYFLNKKYFSDIHKTINKFLKHFPMPELLYIIDIPVETAFKRKNDIPSIDFLKKRYDIYKNIGNIYKSKHLDGTKKVSDLANLIIEDIKIM